MLPPQIPITQVNDGFTQQSPDNTSNRSAAYLPELSAQATRATVAEAYYPALAC